ncbi:MAG: hypothetical protein KC619_05455 [Myxococcales bacterium]|nr:hypothetical protein [Myxococcales bacterium]
MACVIALALGAWGCDNDGDMDGGTPGTDAGTDAGGGGTDAGPEDGGGMTDAGTDGGGTDAGPPMNFEIRLVNNVPGLTGTTAIPGGFHVCTYIQNNTTLGIVPGTVYFATQTVGPVPFRGVSPYLGFTAVAPFNYLVALYDPPNLGDPAACPDDPNADGAPEAVLVATVEPAAVPVDSNVTAVATGFVPDTLGATGGALPSICINPGTGAFDALCTETTRLLTVIDDEAPPASGMTRVRVSNQIANTPGATGFTVCYDPTLVPNTPPATGCVDTNPADSATALVTAQAFGTMSDYADRDAILPTNMPVAGVGGGIYLRVEDGMGCTPAFTAGDACYPMLAMLPAMDPPLPDNIRPDLAADTINTIFISGAIVPNPVAPPAWAAAFAPSFFIWQDDYVAP